MGGDRPKVTLRMRGEPPVVGILQGPRTSDYAISKTRWVALDDLEGFQVFKESFEQCAVFGIEGSIYPASFVPCDD